MLQVNLRKKKPKLKSLSSLYSSNMYCYRPIIYEVARTKNFIKLLKQFL